ncbi:MAG: hypothetical protein ACM3IL_00030, partial [Deltaproteobacteria bacterium]
MNRAVIFVLKPLAESSDRLEKLQNTVAQLSEEAVKRGLNYYERSISRVVEETRSLIRISGILKQAIDFLLAIDYVLPSVARHNYYQHLRDMYADGHRAVNAAFDSQNVNELQSSVSEVEKWIMTMRAHATLLQKNADSNSKDASSPAHSESKTIRFGMLKVALSSLTDDIINANDALRLHLGGRMSLRYVFRKYNRAFRSIYLDNNIRRIVEPYYDASFKQFMRDSEIRIICAERGTYSNYRGPILVVHGNTNANGELISRDYGPISGVLREYMFGHDAAQEVLIVSCYPRLSLMSGNRARTIHLPEDLPVQSVIVADGLVGYSPQMTPDADMDSAASIQANIAAKLSPGQQLTALKYLEAKANFGWWAQTSTGHFVVANRWKKVAWNGTEVLVLPHKVVRLKEKAPVNMTGSCMTGSSPVESECRLLRDSLRNNNIDEAKSSLARLKSIDTKGLKKALKPLLEILFDERIDSGDAINWGIMREISLLLKEIRNSAWGRKIQREVDITMRSEFIPVEGEYPAFFDPAQGIYEHLDKTIIPHIINDFEADLASGKKIQVHSAGGVYFYKEGARFSNAYLAVIIFREHLLEKGVNPDQLEIVVTGINKRGLAQGKEGKFGIEWFIKQDKPLSAAEKARVKRHFDFTEDGQLQAKNYLRQLISTKRISLTKFVQPSKFHLIIYTGIEYRVELRQKEEDPLRTNIIAGNIIDNLKEDGYLLTTAEKWFTFGEDNFTFTRPLAHTSTGVPAGLPVTIFYGDKKLEGMAKVYQRKSLVSEKDINYDYSNLLVATNYEKDFYGRGPTNKVLLNKAYILAKLIHGKQKRANGEPYLLHLLVTAVFLLQRFDLIRKFQIESDLYEMILAIALLHDAWEEDKDAISKIEEGLRSPYISPEAVQEIVSGVKQLTKRQNEPDKEYLDRVSGSDKFYIPLIKMADRLHNLSTPRYKWKMSVFIQYVTESRNFVEGLQHRELGEAKAIFLREIDRLYTSALHKRGFKNSPPASSSPVTSRQVYTALLDYQSVAVSEPFVALVMKLDKAMEELFSTQSRPGEDTSELDLMPLQNVL